MPHCCCYALGYLMNVPLLSSVLEMPTESVSEELLYEYLMEVGLGRSIIYNLINFIHIINSFHRPVTNRSTFGTNIICSQS